MRELYLSIEIRTKRGLKTVLKETAGDSWELRTDGVYIAQIAGEDLDYEIPMTSVKYGRRAKPAAKKP